ncbi:MAG: hypothetical protein ACTSP9_12760 [Promethearchaeota archaeon]
MEIIKYLGSKLSESIELSLPAGRGLIKLAIKDELGPFHPINQLNYEKLVAVIQNSLKNRLLDLNIPNFEEVLKNLLDELNSNQSLITIAGV